MDRRTHRQLTSVRGRCQVGSREWVRAEVVLVTRVVGAEVRSRRWATVAVVAVYGHARVAGRRRLSAVSLVGPPSWVWRRLRRVPHLHLDHQTGFVRLGCGGLDSVQSSFVRAAGRPLVICELQGYTTRGARPPREGGLYGCRRAVPAELVPDQAAASSTGWWARTMPAAISGLNGWRRVTMAYSQRSRSRSSCGETERPYACASL
jgi:hypothetical protein